MKRSRPPAGFARGEPARDDRLVELLVRLTHGVVGAVLGGLIGTCVWFWMLRGLFALAALGAATGFVVGFVAQRRALRPMYWLFRWAGFFA